MRRDTLTVRARYVVPVEGAPIEDGCLTMQGPRIGWLGPADQRDADLDLGNVAIVPGFVNAHTHLELAALEGDNGSPRSGPEDELGWLKRVISQRRGASDATLRLNAADNLRARKVYTQVQVIGRVIDAVIGLFALASVLMLFSEVRHVGTSLLASAGIVGIIAGVAAQ